MIVNRFDLPQRANNLAFSINVQLPQFLPQESCTVGVHVKGTGNFKFHLKIIDAIPNSLTGGADETASGTDPVFVGGFATQTGGFDPAFTVEVSDLNSPGTAPGFDLVVYRNG